MSDYLAARPYSPRALVQRVAFWEPGRRSGVGVSFSAATTATVGCWPTSWPTRTPMCNSQRSFCSALSLAPAPISRVYRLSDGDPPAPGPGELQGYSSNRW